MFVLEGLPSDIESVVYSTDGKLLAAAFRGDIIWLWDALSSARVRSLQTGAAISSIAFSPDGKILAAGCWDNTVCLLGVTSGKLLFQLEDHKNGVTGVAFSPDQTLLASASVDHTIRLRDLPIRNDAKSLGAELRRRSQER